MAKVAILDADGVEWPEFGLGDCDAIRIDSTAHVATWRGSASVAGLAGKTVRLRFEMRNTNLYAFEFTGHPPRKP